MNILFDLDGTLMDPREGIVACFKHALLGLGHMCTPDSELERHIGPPLQESFAVLLGSADSVRINTAVELYRQRFSAKGMFENAVYPGVHSALAQLQSLGAALYISTSKPRVFAERIVAHFGLECYFRAIYGSELDGTRSNKRDLIANILKTERMSSDTAFMVGDRAHDMIGAKANRVCPIGALWGFGTREELRVAGATLFCERPEVLSELFLSENGIQRANTGGYR